MSTVTDVREEGCTKTAADTAEVRKITWPCGESEAIRRLAEQGGSK